MISILNVQKVLDVALGEVGYLEKATNDRLDDKKANAGSGNYTKYARDLDAISFYNGPKNGYSWCDVFVDWCFYKAYGEDAARKLLFHGPLGAGCTWSARYFAQNGQFFASPEIGDQVFFGTGRDNCYHTGLVYDVDGSFIYTVEGNTAPQSGVIENGGGVYKKAYRRNNAKIVGYGRPVYERDDIMTGKEIFEALNAYLEAQPLPDALKNELDEAVALGITDGSGPMALCRRVEAMLMAKRAALPSNK